MINDSLNYMATWYDVSDGKGFCSVVLRITFTFVDSKDSEDVYTTILKIPGIENYHQIFDKSEGFEIKYETILKICDLHNTECGFYTEIAPILSIPLPKVFATKTWTVGKNEGCVHMEDLKEYGKVINYYNSASVEQVKNVIRHLALMHKQILTDKTQIWKGKYLCGELAAAVMLEKCLEKFLEWCEYKEPYLSYIKKYKKFMLNNDFFIYALKEAPKELSIPTVIAHGDLWGGNIMWKINDNGEIGSEVSAFIDWQNMFEGSPMNDIARLITNNCSGEIRREIEKDLINLYYNQLKEEMEKEKIKMPYTKEQLKKIYQIQFVMEAIVNFILFKLSETTNKEKDAKRKKEMYEIAMAKTLHALEDMDKLLQGDLKYLFERFGQ
uniref:CHK kinase-like domain-containing protein n=1 Tax=Panagrolaimus davidi TaxID=227884 RepID=A0A914PD03_9BILA